MSTPPKTLAEARAKIAELEKKIADLKPDSAKGANVPATVAGTIIPLEAAALILAAWAKTQRVALDSGTMYGDSHTYHVRLTDEGTIRLSIEPPAFAEAERLEKKRVAEARLAEAIADVRGAASSLAAVKAAIAERGNDDPADHVAMAESVLNQAKAERKAAEQALADATVPRAPAFEVEIPGTLAGLEICYRD